MRVERAPKSNKIVVLDRHRSPGTIYGLLPTKKYMLPDDPLCASLYGKLMIFFFFNKERLL